MVDNVLCARNFSGKMTKITWNKTATDAFTVNMLSLYTFSTMPFELEFHNNSQKSAHSATTKGRWKKIGTVALKNCITLTRNGTENKQQTVFIVL